MVAGWLCWLTVKLCCLGGVDGKIIEAADNVVRTVPVGAVCCFENPSNTPRANSNPKEDLPTNMLAPRLEAERIRPGSYVLVTSSEEKIISH
jgi:hypothetical protein